LVSRLIKGEIYEEVNRLEDEVAWIDKNYKHYSMDEISDSHLINILRFISDGGGYDHFLTEGKIINLLKEAFDRGLINKMRVFIKE
jgi:hypothetical protein